MRWSRQGWPTNWVRSNGGTLEAPLKRGPTQRGAHCRRLENLVGLKSWCSPLANRFEVLRPRFDQSPRCDAATGNSWRFGRGL